MLLILLFVIAVFALMGKLANLFGIPKNTEQQNNDHLVKIGMPPLPRPVTSVEVMLGCELRILAGKKLLAKYQSEHDHYVSIYQLCNATCSPFDDELFVTGPQIFPLCSFGASTHDRRAG